jgi:PAS domain S-box-containing protein
MTPHCDTEDRRLKAFEPLEDPRMMVDAIPHIVWVASPDGVTTYFNQQGTEYTGRSRETNYGWNWVTLVHPEDAERAREGWATAVRTETEFVLDYRIRRFDAAFRWHAFRARPVRQLDGEIQSWIGTATDIHDRKELELSLRRSEREALETVALLQSIEAAAPVGFKLVDRDLRVVRINETLARISGMSADEVIGRTAQEMVPEIWPQLEGAYRSALDGETICGLDVSMPSADDPGRLRHWLASYYPVKIDNEIIGVGNVVVEITDRKEAEEFLGIVVDNMAEGLYALDGEGVITFMNPAASQMLGWTEGELRRRSMHETVHSHCADGTHLPASECPILRVLTTGHSVRIADDAFTCRDGTVLPVAYSAAALGNGTANQGIVVVFRDITEEKKEQAALQRELAALSWVGRIRDAIDEDRFVVYSQPIVPLTGGRPSEELLLRMIGRNGEVILPGAFLPVAERYGLIAEIDRWVITQAVRLAADGDRTIEANLSATSIETSDLVSFIERQIREAGADPTKLVFEITETALMKDITAGMEFAHRVREIGCGLALDDFGTGYGSFTYLKNLPLSYLKIDVDFVRDLATNPANRHVVAAIVSLAKAFGLQTIAEGVENEETVALLRNNGVDYAQGFHLGRPEPVVRRDAANQLLVASG